MPKKVTIRVTDQEYEDLKYQAAQNRVSVTELCRLRAVHADDELLRERKGAWTAIQTRRLFEQVQRRQQNQEKALQGDETHAVSEDDE